MAYQAHIGLFVEEDFDDGDMLLGGVDLAEDTPLEIVVDRPPKHLQEIAKEL